MSQVPRARARKSVRRKKVTRKTVQRKRARRNVVRGYGDYVVNPEHNRGQQLGGEAGAWLGEKLGGLAHGIIGSAISGLGDYTVKKNTLLAPEVPTIINDSVKGGITFRHKEYLRDIITSPTPGAFNLDSFLINPGNEKTFGWLSQIAPNFEQYSLEGMIFEFRSMSADALNSTNTALGSVIMATNYDAIDTNFTTKGQMENYEWGMSCKPSSNMLHPIECAPRQSFNSELYVLNGPVPAGSDARLYHWGNMQIATTGFQGASVNIGELWVTYQVRLLKPKIFTAMGGEIGTYLSVNSSYTNALPLGNGTLNLGTDTIGIILDPPNRNIGFPILGIKKHYQVTLRWTGSLASFTYPTITYTEATQSIATLYGPAGGETCTACMMQFYFVSNENKFPVITIGAAGVLPTAGNSLRIVITELNPMGFF